jgi:hypothetical protein
MQKLKRPVPPPSTGKPEVIHANKPIHAPTIDPNYDFTGVIREKLPYWVLKTAKHGAVQNHVVVGRIECINCKRLAWTCDKRLEDTCEECDFLMHEENRDLQIVRARRQLEAPHINPFAESEDGPSDSITIRR